MLQKRSEYKVCRTNEQDVTSITKDRVLLQHCSSVIIFGKILALLPCSIILAQIRRLAKYAYFLRKTLDVP